MLGGVRVCGGSRGLFPGGVTKAPHWGETQIDAPQSPILCHTLSSPYHTLSHLTYVVPHLITQHGPEVAVDVNPRQRALSPRIQLVEPVKDHHGLLPHLIVRGGEHGHE